MVHYLHSLLHTLPHLLAPRPLDGLKRYTRDDLLADVMAGITVAIILVPQGMALAMLAGLPAVYGLYASLPGVIASLWGSSRHLSSGPVAIVSFLTLTSLVPLAQPGTNQFILLAATLALLVGAIQLLMGLLRLGFIMHLIPHSAIIGFASAASAIIVLSQLPNLLGFSISSHDLVIQTIADVLRHLIDLTPLTACIGLFGIIALLLLRQLPKIFPAALAVLILGIIASFSVGFEQLGVAVVGVIPQSLPGFVLPPIGLSVLGVLIPKAAIIALIGFVEAHAISRAVAAQSKQRLNIDKELVGQGLANLAAGVFSGYPVSGSFVRTAVNVDSGGRTAIAAVVTGLMTVGVLLLLTPLFYHLPKAILAAIVIVSAARLIDVRRLFEMYKVSRSDGVIAGATFIMSFLLKPDDAIFIGIILGLVLFIYKTVWGAAVSEMGIDPRWGVLRSVKQVQDAERLPGVMVIRLGMSLYYANSEHMLENAKTMLGRHGHDATPLRHIVLDCSGVNQIDVTGIEALADFINTLRDERGIITHAIYMRTNVTRKLHAAGKHFPGINHLHNIAEMRELTANPKPQVTPRKPKRRKT